MAKTHNAGDAYPEYNDPFVTVFSKAESIRDKNQKSFYSDTKSEIDKLKAEWRKAFGINPYRAMQLLFWLRDPRGGAGNRQFFRDIVKESTLPGDIRPWIKANIPNIPRYGRFDDIQGSLYGTSMEEPALDFLAQNMHDRLAAKWIKRKDSKLKTHVVKNYPELKIKTNKDFRKFLVKHTEVVETPMCAKAWGDIKYEQVPSIAGIRYAKAFKKNDTDRYEAFLNDKSTRMKAGVAFPHEIWRIAEAGDDAVEKFFDSLPGMWSTNLRIMPLIDTSGSMSSDVSGKIRAIDVAAAMGFFFSDRLVGPFHRTFITFQTQPALYNWYKKSVADAMRSILDVPWGGSASITRAIDLMLDTGISYKLKPEQMPEVLITFSDTQFDRGTTEGGGGWWKWRNNEENDSTPPKEGSEVEKALDKWAEHGYSKPGVIYWNLSSYKGQPSNKPESVGLLSGFSTNVAKDVMQNLERDENGKVIINTYKIMESAISKYEVIAPK